VFAAPTRTHRVAVTSARAPFNGCLDGFYNFDGNDANGCEYQCVYTSADDVPDVTPFGPGIGVDANCDGVDGVALQSVFVLPGSSVANPGTMAQPVPTIARAIEIASGSATRRNIIVAAGTYNEAITLPAGINLYGGYTRVNALQWTRAVRTTSPSVVQSTTRFGMNFSSISTVSPSRVQNMVIVAAAASVAGESSYGVRLQNSPGVTIEHSTIQAGAGAAGANGSNGGVGAAGGNGGAGTQGCDGCSGEGFGGGAGSGPCGGSGGAGGRGGHSSSSGSSGRARIWPRWRIGGRRRLRPRERLVCDRVQLRWHRWRRRTGRRCRHRRLRRRGFADWHGRRRRVALR
jgi:hypothetical protein